MRTVIANQGDTVDLICWREYGRTDGVTEAVLEANPGLADHGAVLPLGTQVSLPDVTPTQKQTTVTLWD